MPIVRALVASCALALATACAAAPSAQVKPLPPGGLTITEISDWLQDQGYRAQVKKTAAGRAYLESSAEGYTWLLDVYDCDKEMRCTSMQVYAYFKPQPAYDVALMNKWNMMKRWTAAYLDDDGSATIQMDINLPKNYSFEALEEDLDIWFMMLRQFGEHLDQANSKAN